MWTSTTQSRRPSPSQSPSRGRNAGCQKCVSLPAAHCRALRVLRVLGISFTPGAGVGSLGLRDSRASSQGTRDEAYSKCPSAWPGGPLCFAPLALEYSTHCTIRRGRREPLLLRCRDPSPAASGTAAVRRALAAAPLIIASSQSAIGPPPPTAAPRDAAARHSAPGAARIPTGLPGPSRRPRARRGRG